MRDPRILLLLALLAGCESPSEPKYEVVAAAAAAAEAAQEESPVSAQMQGKTSSASTKRCAALFSTSDEHNNLSGRMQSDAIAQIEASQKLFIANSAPNHDVEIRIVRSARADPRDPVWRRSAGSPDKAPGTFHTLYVLLDSAGVFLAGDFVKCDKDYPSCAQQIVTRATRICESL